MLKLRDEILKEHSKAQAIKIASYACESPKHFRQLMKCFLDEEYRLAQRAAWAVSWTAKQKPDLILPHIKDLVAVLDNQNVHDAVIRNSVRVLQETDIPKKFHGKVMNASFRFLEKPSTAVAIEVFSLTTLFNLSGVYPEITAELKLIIKENMQHETAAFKARAGKIWPKLEQHAQQARPC